MTKYVYNIDRVILLDETEVILSPLKIKYLKRFMEIFGLIDHVQNQEQAIDVLSECAVVCIQQQYPIIQTKEQLEDLVDMHMIYKIIDVCAGVKIDPNKDNVDEQAKEEKDKSSWGDLDLLSLEAEIFTIGAWKNFEELEVSLTMSELILILEKIRELDYNEKKFLAAMQGVDLDKESGKANEWEEMKAKVFSGGNTQNPDDILSLQGYNAQKAGFGIGLGLEYEKIERKKD
jgi:hypothetical protein